MATKRPKAKVKAKAKPAKKAVKRKTVTKVRKAVPKRRKAAATRAAKTVADPSLEKVGEVTHYFPHVNAAAVMIVKGTISVGDDIYIKGHTSDFKERIDSLQLDRAAIDIGKKGQEIGLRVKERVRIGDSVYRIKR